MAVIISKQMVLPQMEPDYTITFTYDSASSKGTIWASVTLPDGRVIHHDNKIASVGVNVGDILRIFVIAEQYTGGGGICINGVDVVDCAETTGTWYDYTITKSATIYIDILQPGVNVRDPETGEIIDSSPAFRRGLVTITEL